MLEEQSSKRPSSLKSTFISGVVTPRPLIVKLAVVLNPGSKVELTKILLLIILTTFDKLLPEPVIEVFKNLIEPSLSTISRLLELKS